MKLRYQAYITITARIIQRQLKNIQFTVTWSIQIKFFATYIRWLTSCLNQHRSWRNPCDTLDKPSQLIKLKTNKSHYAKVGANNPGTSDSSLFLIHSWSFWGRSKKGRWWGWLGAKIMTKYCLYLTEIRTSNDLNNDGHNNILTFTTRVTFLNCNNHSCIQLFKVLYNIY